MGRKSAGWKFRPQRTPGAIRTIRFTWAGQVHNRSTGYSDLARASAEAARIYSDVVQRVPRPVRSAQSGQALEAVLGQWLAFKAPTLRAKTLKTWTLYCGTHFNPFFLELHNVTDAVCLQYRNLRLQAVKAGTVKRELTALRGFCAWAFKNGHISTEIKIEPVPKGSLGVAHTKRRRVTSPDVSPAEVEQMLALLPEWSGSKKVARFPIQARFRFAYATSLRPETIDQLRVPEHYSPGRETITIPDIIDKNGEQRQLPLSEAARAALDSVCPTEGLIFGKHDYREHTKKAADAVLAPHKARVFTGTHFRSARITHWLEDPNGGLLGAQFMAGHKLATTTALYAKASERAATEMLAAMDRPEPPKAKTKRTKKTPPQAAVEAADRALAGVDRQAPAGPNEGQPEAAE